MEQTINELNISFFFFTCMRSSVSKSTDAVASSNINTFVLRNRARAKHTNWRCPTDKFSPPLNKKHTWMTWMSLNRLLFMLLFYLRKLRGSGRMLILLQMILNEPIPMHAKFLRPISVRMDPSWDEVFQRTRLDLVEWLSNVVVVCVGRVSKCLHRQLLSNHQLIRWYEIVPTLN